MFATQFINDFSSLGSRLLSWSRGEVTLPLLDRAVDEAYRSNPFFTPYMQRNAIASIARCFLCREELERWLGNYREAIESENRGENLLKTGIIMAGNIPLVGFHDFLSALAAQCCCYIKLSSKDRRLLPVLAGMLVEMNHEWGERIRFLEREQMDLLHGMERLISTGSDATAGSVASEFSDVPSLIRGRRFSYAVVDDDSSEALKGLEEDIFLYYGLGCRNVSYLLVKSGADIGKVVSYLKNLAGEGNKRNNFILSSGISADRNYLDIYRRNKALYTMEGKCFIDGGFFLMVESDEVTHPLGVVGYRKISDDKEILDFERVFGEKIQKRITTFGMAQSPAVDDYADGADTMRFLLG